MILYGIIGAGGFGREVAPLVQQQLKMRTDATKSASEVILVVEDQFYKSADPINGYRVMSMSDFLSVDAESRYFNIAIGNSTVRERIANSIPPSIAKPFSVTAPNHLTLDNNEIGDGAIFCSFTHVTSNARIGRFFHCNIYSYVAHDVTIGDFVTFAPGVKVNGHVSIEDHAYIGTGAIIKDGTEKPITIGRGAIVGMGAVVTKSVAPGAVVIGNPAKPINK